jgi:hypothetical protein
VSRFRRARAGRKVCDDWDTAVDYASTWATQLARPYRVTGLRVRAGWVWQVKPIPDATLHPFYIAKTLKVVRR